MGELYGKLVATNLRVELALRAMAGGREVRVDGFGFAAQHPAGAPLSGCDFVYRSGGSPADLARFGGVVRVGCRESATPHEITVS